MDVVTVLLYFLTVQTISQIISQIIAQLITPEDRLTLQSGLTRNYGDFVTGIILKETVESLQTEMGEL